MRNNHGAGALTALFITLLVLKLCGIVTMSWWWVFSPLLFWVAIFALTISWNIWSNYKQDRDWQKRMKRLNEVKLERGKPFPPAQ